jgi:hypothetical protein
MERIALFGWGRTLLTSLMMLGPVGALADTALVRDLPTVHSEPRRADPTVIRSRPVQVNLHALRTQGPQRLSLALFDGARMNLLLERQERMPGGFVWVGRVEGLAQSLVTLSTVDDVVVGNIETGEGALYQLRYEGNAIHSLREVDPARFKDETHTVDEASTKEPRDLMGQQLVDTGELIDVMVVYTAAARSDEGGTAAMNALINLAVSTTNTTYANSGIHQRIRLVHAAEVDYAETKALGTDRGRLQDPKDGFMDGVHSLRDTYKADLVSLFVSDGDGSCGIGYILTSVSTASADRGFSVVDKNCAVGNYSFAHELGHNMGARHDRFKDNTDNSPYPYNHGYFYAPGKWRTVMAYKDGCEAAGTSCRRIPYWSNPDKFYNGVPMGVPSPSPSAADNRQTLNNTASTVANFRVSQ